ncbi:alpha/beta hydrolase [Nocardia sp. AG03]|uniref:alpha/beta hydrolase n=1 Tax=Nocardia sp. AG03 TaxID=3025312 RepID=UPI002418B37E|nr:alpha/beta hydrolase [Nocardia sp. AG03]
MTVRDFPTTGPGAVPDPEVAAMLAALDAGFPDVAAMEAAEVRAAIRARRGPLQRIPAMRTVHDITIDGAGGPLPLRVYRPHPTPDSLPTDSAAPPTSPRPTAMAGAPLSTEGAAPGAAAAQPTDGSALLVGDAPHVDDHALISAALPVIVFAHGGGFVFCDLDSHDEFCRAMAVGVGAVVVSVDYRLAPEHPAPAAHDDFLAALRWTAAHASEYGGDPARIAVAGDSAGGNLAATVALAVRDHDGPPLAAQILLYPVIDDDVDTESYRRFGTGHYNTTRAMRWYWRQYAPHGTDDVRLVPTRATTLAGLPPAVVVTAELDPPCSAGDAYAQRLARDGVPVRHRRYDGLFHGFLTIPSLSATVAARAEVWAMVRDVLG